MKIFFRKWGYVVCAKYCEKAGKTAFFVRWQNAITGLTDKESSGYTGSDGGANEDFILVISTSLYDKKIIIDKQVKDIQQIPQCLL